MKYLKSILFCLASLTLMAFAFVEMAVAQTSPASLEPCHTGAWYDPTFSGQGFLIDVDASHSVVAWFTLDNTGNPIWFTSSTAPDANGFYTLYDTHGDVWTHAPVVTAPAGSLALAVLGDDSLTASFALSWPSAYCSGFGPGEPLCKGTLHLVRLTKPVACPAG